MGGGKFYERARSRRERHRLALMVHSEVSRDDAVPLGGSGTGDGTKKRKKYLFSNSNNNNYYNNNNNNNNKRSRRHRIALGLSQNKVNNNNGIVQASNNNNNNNNNKNVKKYTRSKFADEKKDQVNGKYRSRSGIMMMKLEKR